MRIGELARRVGVPVDTVRFYERNGLLPPPRRRPSGYRDYDESDVQCLRFVLWAKRAGFRLVEIRELIDLAEHGRADLERMRISATLKLAQLERHLDELQRIRDGLRALLETAASGRPPEGCPLRAAVLAGGRLSS